MTSILLVPPVLASTGSVLVAILGVGFLIFVHELGHFLACRLTRTRVETFSIGFGTRLFGWERVPGEPRRFTVGRRRYDPADHAMDFRVALVPLGGYVKMAGENPGEDRTGSPDEFPSKSVGARVLIVCAGVVMNLVAAVVFYFIAFAGHVAQPPAMVGRVVPGGPAWEAGLEPGDRILTLGGTRLRSFTELRMETVFLPSGQEAPIEIERAGAPKSLRIAPRYDDELGLNQLEVGPAYVLTLEDGDRRLDVGADQPVTVAGIPTRGGAEASRLLNEALSARPGEAVEVVTPEGGFLVELRPAKPEPDATPVYKIGLEAYARPEVTSVRGRAAEHLRKGDRLVSAKTGAGVVPLEASTALARLPFVAPLESVTVRRVGAEERTTIRVDAKTPAEVHAWVSGVAARSERTNAVNPIPPGFLTRVEDQPGSWRYPSSPGGDAGIGPGDRVLRIGTKDVEEFRDIVDALNGVTTNAPLKVLVESPTGDKREVEVVPVALERLAGPVLAGRRAEEPFQTDGVLDAAAVALRRTGQEVTNIFRLIGSFFTGNISFGKSVAGPATIVTVSASAAEQSFLQFLLFLAYISVTLAVLNILPIPILDGGHLVFILVEKVKGSPLKDETIGKLQFVGLMLLLLLMFFAFRNDFYNIVGR